MQNCKNVVQKSQFPARPRDKDINKKLILTTLDSEIICLSENRNEKHI